jgi:hypothetical protein
MNYSRKKSPSKLKIHASNDGNMVVEIGGYKVKDSTDTKPTAAILSVYLKEGRKIHLPETWGSSDMPLEKNKDERHSKQVSFFICFQSLINSVLTQIICLLLEY